MAIRYNIYTLDTFSFKMVLRNDTPIEGTEKAMKELEKCLNADPSLKNDWTLVEGEYLWGNRSIGFKAGSIVAIEEDKKLEKLRLLSEERERTLLRLNEVELQIHDLESELKVLA